MSFASLTSRFVTLAAALALLIACEDSAPRADASVPVKTVGDACDDDDPCPESLECNSVFGKCTRSCATDEDCGPWLCIEVDGGGSECMPECGGALRQLPNYVCVEDRPVRCEDAGDAFDCGLCSCGTARCVDGVGCQDRFAVGEACAFDRDCASNNCGKSGECRVALGAPCTVDNCDRCMTTGDWSSCSRACTFESDCQGGACVGYEGTEGLHCYEACDESTDCPGPCDSFDDADDAGVATAWCECAACTIAQ